MPERRVDVVLPPELAAIWSRLVKDAQTDEEVLKRLIMMAAPSRRARLTRAPLAKPSMNMNVTISRSDAAAAKRLAEASGFTLSAWVRALLIAHLRRKPQYAPEELRIHSVIRYEVQRIASTMRAAAQRQAPQESQVLLDAYADARRQLFALRSAIAGSLLYWEIEDE